MIVQFMVVAGLFSAQAIAQSQDPKKVEPYLEKLREKYEIKQRPVEVYPAMDPNQKVVEKPLSKDPHQVQPYIERLRESQGLQPSDQVQDDKPDPHGDPTLGGATDRHYQPYIESLKAGHTLKMKIPDVVRQAAGISVVASNKFDIKSDKAQANSFESVYEPNNKYAPSADLFYEYQVFRSRAAGAIGIIGHLNFMTIKGKGVFTRSGNQSTDTLFRFYALPITVAATYRLVQTRFIVPYVQFGVTGIPILETRDDGKASRKAISRGINGIAGIAFNLDWISRHNAWDQYDSNSVLHSYITLQMEYLRTLSGPIVFNHNGLYAGLMFEF